MAGFGTNSIRNFFGNIGLGHRKDSRNLRKHISPTQLQRIRQDVSTWRSAVTEAENVWYPYRVKLQQLYQDTILNGHVTACMSRRKNLTLLKDYHLCNAKDKTNEDATKIIKDQAWFYSMLNYALDANFFGYSLVSFGDIEQSRFPYMELMPRQNVSPDRLVLSSYDYSPVGIEFLSDEYRDYVLWVPTATETGSSKCGFGMLYKVALYEIFLRNILGDNADFTQLYSQPYRVAKTTKTEESERAELEAVVRDMGSSGYALIDPTDEIEFLETALGGTGWKGYADFEERCEKKISKIVLGHADAIDSRTGKLGSDETVKDALKEIEATDSRFLQTVVNEQILPKLRNLGFSIPEDVQFKFKNDKEIAEQRKQEDESNKVTADIVKTLNDSGFEVDAEYIVKRTGIPVVKKEVKEPVVVPPKNEGISNHTRERIKNIYA